MIVYLKRHLRLFITGFSMGTADLVPGFSGGTVAFLSGIYEELLESIKIATGQAIRLALKGKIVEAIRVVPWQFLLPLGIGLLSAVFLLANLLSYLLVNHPVYIWSFFFGLVVASIYIVLQRIKKWKISDGASFIVAAVATYFVVGAVPVETPATLPYFFFSGVVAICAMILPGISGSFILLLLGKYHQVLEAVNDRDIVTLATVAAGCLVGLAVFSRFLSWLFKHHHDISVAVLSGIMLGSLRKLWPWREVVLTRVNSHGEVVPLVEKNILPDSFDMMVFFALMLALGAGLAVWYLNKLQLVKEQEVDLETGEFKKSRKN